MSSYLKPQSPLYHKEKDTYFYPLTTEDQVVMDDGRRLSGTNFLSIDKEGSSFDEPNPINADTLDGKLASEYATNDFVNEKVRKAAPRNLLDNSDFSNPVNQRGSTKYMSSSAYTIDRWNAWHENGKTHVSIEDGYLKIWAENTGEGSFSQRFIKGLLSEDKNYTFAYKTNEGNIVINNNPVVYGEAYDHVEITLSANETVNTEWAALYEGEYTAETLPEYQPKGYGVELLECRRYFMNGKIDIVHYLPQGGFRGEIPLIQPFRVTPTISFPGNLIIYNNNATTFEANFSWHAVYPNRALIVFSSDGSSSVTPGYSYIAHIDYEINADL